MSAQYENRKYDMQVLLKLILTYNIYLGCIIYEILSFSKLCTAFAINVSNCEHNVSIIDLINESKSSLTCPSNERCCYSDIYSQSCFIQQFTLDKLKVDLDRQNKKLTLLQRYWKGVKRNFHLYFQTNVVMIYQRKLLGYEQNFFRTRPTKHSRSNRIHREVTLARVSDLTKRKKRNVIAKDSTAWDNWSIWSPCSVSCGQGRQVRWRHCLSAYCIEGLKKAQLRSCHLKDCGTKGFLGWLGIKS